MPDAASVSLPGGVGDLATITWPGDGATGLFLAHATGFCKEVWEPVVAHLRPYIAGSIVAWDGRAHGASSAGTPPFDWWDFGRDALEVVDSIDLGIRVGVGHSMGGAALAMAEILRPGTFDGLVLIEPIVFPPPFGRFDNMMAEVARKRRSFFASPEEAHSNFAGKAVFSAWDSRAMEAYIRGGLRVVDDAWLLSCSPHHEAEVYRGGSAHGAFDRLGEIGIPVLLLAGEHSTTHDEDLVEILLSQLVSGSAVIVPDAGHFLPMEKPATVAELILYFTSRLT